VASETASVIHVVDDVFDVAQEEVTEDFRRAGMLVPLVLTRIKLDPAIAGG
jgi:Mg/Co/Ni transporter MgtE